MTYAREFESWQEHKFASDYNACSPALVELREALDRRWGPWVALGCFNRRVIAGTVLPSSHWYGAAIDLRWSIDRSTVLAECIPYLVAWSEEWGLQRIHDYIGCRIWTAGRTGDTADACSTWWKAQRAGDGMGESWATYLHLEVTPTRWNDGRTEGERGII